MKRHGIRWAMAFPILLALKVISGFAILLIGALVQLWEKLSGEEFDAP